MTDMRVTRFLILTLCVLLLAGCGKKASDEIDYGAVTDSVYHNKYFGLKMALPSGWSVQDQAMRQRVVSAGMEVVSGGDRKIKAALEASEQQSVNLLMAFQHPVGSPVGFNPSIICLAERVRDLPGIVRGKDYHVHAKKFMESGPAKLQFPGEISTERLGGIDFDVMYVLRPVGPQNGVQRKYYATIMKGYALVFVVSFTTAQQESALQEVLAGVSFE